MSFLDDDHLNNCHLIHAVQKYSLESIHASFWGAYNGRQLQGVLYTEDVESGRFGSLAGENSKALANLGKFASRSGIEVLAGKSNYIIPAISRLRSQYVIGGHYHFYKIHSGELVGRYDHPVHKATKDDIPLLVELYKNSELGGNRNKSRERIEHEIRRAMKFESGYFFVEKDGRAVSAARILAETDRVGLIDGASTLPEYRRQGIYQCVRTACYEYLFQKGKTGLGYFRKSDIVMHRVIDKYGGTIVTDWTIAYMNKRTGQRQQLIRGLLRRSKRVLRYVMSTDA